MSRAAFTKADIERAVAGARRAGLEVVRIEIDRASGRIVILPAATAAVQSDDLDAELEAWRTGHGNG